MQISNRLHLSLPAAVAAIGQVLGVLSLATEHKLIGGSLAVGVTVASSVWSQFTKPLVHSEDGSSPVSPL